MLKQIKNFILGIKPATNQLQCPTIEYLFLNGRMELQNLKFDIKLSEKEIIKPEAKVENREISPLAMFFSEFDK